MTPQQRAETIQHLFAVMCASAATGWEDETLAAENFAVEVAVADIDDAGLTLLYVIGHTATTIAEEEAARRGLET